MHPSNLYPSSLSPPLQYRRDNIEANYDVSFSSVLLSHLTVGFLRSSAFAEGDGGYDNV